MRRHVSPLPFPFVTVALNAKCARCGHTFERHDQSGCDVFVERDPCCVLTAPLAALVCSFVERWERTRPPTRPNMIIGRDDSGAKLRQTEQVFVGAIEHLEAQTRNIDRSGRGVPAATIKKIRAGAVKTTELRDAEALASALGHEEILHNGTLEVIPNPRAETRASCCGSSRPQFEPWSLNGAAASRR